MIPLINYRHTELQNLHCYRSTYKQKKWPPPKERPLLCRETFLDCLTLQEAACHTKRTESRTK